ncbi:MAG: hypothetical protein J07HX5_02099, partial [halophilic archaeon J07HX5]
MSILRGGFKFVAGVADIVSSDGDIRVLLVLDLLLSLVFATAVLYGLDF